MRTVVALALALTLALTATAALTGCFSVRASAGVGASRAGASLEIGLAIGFGAERSTSMLDTTVGVGSDRGTTVLAALAYQREVAPSWKLGVDEPPRDQLWLGGRLGARSPWRDATRADTAAVLGAGAMYLHVLSYDDADTKKNCVFFGMGSETIKAIGVAGWADAQLGGDPELGRGMATVALVYQEQSYVRANDCGD